MVSVYYLTTNFSVVKEMASDAAKSDYSAFMMFFSSQLIFLIAASITVDNTLGMWDVANYAVAAAAIGMFLTIIMVLLKMFMPAKFEKFAIFPAVFLLLWYVIAFGVTTFEGPFLALSNGYFAAWACMLTSG